ncbi:uncharacterized protein LOC123717269 isoform X2 [Pieris brassicae]|uniref:uncharacterized protein LOC123717269 isoform X2 n=1 Tax=Pieris brassicae TaxID=7116 RepID=UPI001E65FC3C|nr:uncharacterized protein LOC123717269 isoform X2 [Pieris brassicae]
MFISYWKCLIVFSLFCKYGNLAPVETENKEQPAEKVDDNNTTPAAETPEKEAADVENVTEPSSSNNATQTAVLTLEPDATTPVVCFYLTYLIKIYKVIKHKLIQLIYYFNYRMS